jgi:YidC/Oxa1 family membrane protein insertase
MSRFLNENDDPGGTKNLMLAVMLLMGFFLVWQSFTTPPPQAPVPAEQADGSVATPETPESPEVPSEVVEGSGDVALVETIEVLPAQVMRLGQHEVSFTNVGARLQSVEVLEPVRYVPHEDIAGIFPAPDELHLPLATRINGLPDLTDNAMFVWDEAASVQDSEGHWTTIVYRWTAPSGDIEVEKRYVADDRAFGIRMELLVHNRSTQTRRFDGMDMRVYGSFSPDGGGMFNQGASIAEALCRGEYGVERKPAKKVDEIITHSGPTDFVAVDERYFMTALAGDTPGSACVFEPVDATHYRSVLRYPEFSVEAAASQEWGFTVYTGPKDEGYLEAFDAGMERSIDFGWFSALALPIRMLLLFLQGFLVNWGLAIIVLTLVIKLVMLPITQKGYESMEKMKKVQPKLKAVQAKYENDKMKLAEEQMKLFKEEGVSPMGGCLPMLAQTPIYIALYRTIWGSTELYNAPFMLWITDLSQADPYFVLPILMGIVMFAQQRLMPQASDNPQMVMVTRIMPIMFTGFMLFLPSGLVLYIFVNMLLSIVQMLYIRKKFASDDTPSKA